MTIKLLIAAIVIFACVLLSKISGKLGIPMLLSFILLGMLFGSDGIFRIPFDNYAFAEQICSAALIFIMFYGGFGTNWNQAKSVAVKSILLSTLGVIITASLTGVFCHYVLNMEWTCSLLIGSLIGSTDAASVFYILRSKKLNLKYNTASLLEVESGSNDPCAYMLTVTLISIANGRAGGAQIGILIVEQIVFGLLFGFVIAAISVYVLRRIRFTTEGFDVIFVVGIALASYALPQLVNGNGFLSVYIVGIVIGNIDINNKKSLVHFFDGITGLMQMLLFFLLGLLSFPSMLPHVILPAVLISLFLTLIARPVAVAIVLAPFRSKLNQILLVSWAGLRGAASIVFTTMVVVMTDIDYDIFHIVFLIVLFSITIQGTLLPYFAEKLNMIDNNADVMKTFNDYSEEVPVRFIQLNIPSEHEWCEKKIKDIILPPESLIVLVKRGSESIIPNGETILQEEDTLILCATSPEIIDDTSLTEICLDDDSRYTGKLISEIPRRDNSLIIMIQRGDQVIIPNGGVRLEAGDVIVINRVKSLAAKKMA